MIVVRLIFSSLKSKLLVINKSWMFSICERNCSTNFIFGLKVLRSLQSVQKLGTAIVKERYFHLNKIISERHNNDTLKLKF